MKDYKELIEGTLTEDQTDKNLENILEVLYRLERMFKPNSVISKQILAVDNYKKELSLSAKAVDKMITFIEDVESAKQMSER